MAEPSSCAIGGRMFAIVKFKNGSKQFFVKKGDLLDIDLLPKQLREDGATLDFDVLLYSDGKEVKVGTPVVDGCTVKASFVEDVEGDKISFMKYKKRKSSSRRRIGHRQSYSRVKIDDIKG